jgi:hypothetical protein
MAGLWDFRTGDGIVSHSWSDHGFPQDFRNMHDAHLYIKQDISPPAVHILI